MISAKRNGITVVEKIIKYLLLGTLGLAAILFVTILIVSDEFIEDVTGGMAEPLLDIKYGVTKTASEKSNTFSFWMSSKINSIIHFSPYDRTPKVRMRLPSAPKPARKSRVDKNKPEPAPIPVEEPTVAPEPIIAAAPEPMPIAELEPALAPEAVKSSEPAPAKVSVSALSAVATNEGTPDPAPVAEGAEQPLSETTTEQASVPPAESTAPPPPPAAEQEQPGEANYQQGLVFYKGTGVERNFGKAAQFFLKAAEAGHIGAQYNLGIMNFFGQTGGQDFANATKWFEKAAGNGHAQAQYNLGLLYYEGKGVAQDTTVALDWIERAASQGYTKAIKALSNVSAYGTD
jgi:hypothetical protein